MVGISLASALLRGGGYALDHIRDAADSMAPRTRRLLHAGRAHPSTLVIALVVLIISLLSGRRRVI